MKLLSTTHFSNNFKSINSLVNKILAYSYKSKPYAKIFINWHDIVGKELFNYAKPARFNGKNKILFLEVECGSAATIVQHMSNNIVHTINTYFNKETVRAIKLIQNTSYDDQHNQTEKCQSAKKDEIIANYPNKKLDVDLYYSLIKLGQTIYDKERQQG